MARELRSILFVEDEPDIQEVAKLALEAVGGFEVTVCSTGAEALAAAPNVKPDLILLDVMMPGMDGPGTMHALRKLQVTANTPVIFMTAKVRQAEIAQYKQLGALDAIVKPFDPMTLSQRISEIYQAAGDG